MAGAGLCCGAGTTLFGWSHEKRGGSDSSFSSDLYLTKRNKQVKYTGREKQSKKQKAIHLSRAQMERPHNTGSTALSISRNYC